jgi:hypothetical protein
MGALIYPSLFFLLLLPVSAVVTWLLRRHPAYALGWFVALALAGWALPPYVHYYECLPDGCVERAVPDPLAPLVKYMSYFMLVLAVVAGLYIAYRWLLSRLA